MPELGWAVRDALTERGYASEIGRTALRWAGDLMPHLPVVASTEVHNAASRVVMSRIGMQEAGVTTEKDSSRVIRTCVPTPPSLSTGTSTGERGCLG